MRISSAVPFRSSIRSWDSTRTSTIAVKSGNVYLGFADRFSGTLIITGEIAEVTTAIEEIVNYFQNTLGYVVCPITRR